MVAAADGFSVGSGVLEATAVAATIGVAAAVAEAAAGDEVGAEAHAAVSNSTVVAKPAFQMERASR